MTDKVIDVAVIGAGPCGLFQAFQLGLQGIRCHVLEAAAEPGGQCSELYADKPIYDIPGIPHILAGDLSMQLLRQLEPFNATFSFNTIVSNIVQAADSTYMLQTADNRTINCRFVVVATGAGAFTPVKMRVDGIDAFENSQLFYREVPEISTGRTSVIGDTQEAVDTALMCVGKNAAVHYIHRKKRMAGTTESLTRLHELADTGRLTILQGKVTDVAVVDNRISDLLVDSSNKQQHSIPTDVILARLGNSPKLQNYTEWGLATNRNLIEVDSARFESNLSGLFIVGDINSYPGKRKLILCGFHEATLVAFAIAQNMNPDKPVHTQYTTTSTELLARLGVTGE